MAHIWNSTATLETGRSVMGVAGKESGDAGLLLALGLQCILLFDSFEFIEQGLVADLEDLSGLAAIPAGLI